MGRCGPDGIEAISSKGFLERVRDLSLGLGALGVASGDRVAIVSESRPDWVMADLAILTGGAVTVPIYPTLSPVQVHYVLQDSGAKAAIVSTREQLAKIQEVRHKLPALEAVILMDGWTPGDSPSVISLDTVADRGHARLAGEWGAGREFRERARAVRPDELATIIYTSGTTGEPKGVMLSHANLASNVKAGADVLQLSEQDVALSFLPLSHSFERTVSYIYLLSGVTVVFAESLETIARDIARVRPTLFTGVPRLYEKLHGAHHREGPGGTGIQEHGLRLGRRGRRRARRGGTAGPIGRAARLAPGLGRRPSGLRQNSRRARRPRPLHGLRQCAAAGGDRGVLPGHRHPDYRRLRPDGDVTDSDRQSARCAACRHGRPRHPRRRAAHRRRRRDPRPRPEHHVRLLPQAGGHRRGAARRLVPHRRHRRDRRGRATCESPIARRTCS